MYQKETMDRESVTHLSSFRILFTYLDDSYSTNKSLHLT